jgi:outer membrane receptor protein involved in Fe transport
VKYSWNVAASILAVSIGSLGASTAWAEDSPDEIIVTAEKTHRTLRETASSVVVETQDDIRRRAALYSLNDLLARIPNMVSVEPGNEAPAVRGIDGTGPAGGAVAFLAGTRPRLNYQVDGRTLGFNEALFTNGTLWDVAQAEVYRGPQSTQQGRNAIAGMIALRTVDPTFEWHGAARGIVGNRDEVQLSGAIGGPVVDGIAAFRLSGDWQRSQSFLSLTPYPEASDPGQSDIKTFRAKLLLTPASNIRSLWTLSYQDGRQPQAAQVKQPYSAHEAYFPKMPVFRSRTTTLISDSSIALSENVTFQAYFSASDFRVNRYTPAGTGNLQIDGKEYVVQPFLRLRSSDDRFSGFLAAYVFRTHQNEVIDLFGGGHWRDETDTTAVFGEMTIKPVDRLSLILGARYEVEKRHRDGSAGVFVTLFDETYKEFLPKATISYDLSDAVTIGATVGRGYNAGGAGITFSPPIVTYTYKPEFVWNYEGFVRADLGRGFSLNGNVFYNDYKNIQLPFYLSALSTVIANADKATTWGGELQLDWRPAGKNRLFASIGLLDTRIDRYTGQAELEGNDLGRAPAFSAAAGFVFSPDGRLELGADMRYSDAYYSDVLNSARGKIDPYVVVNGQVAYDFGPARVFFSVRNLFNDGSPTMIYAGATAAADYAAILEPRKVLGGIELRF